MLQKAKKRLARLSKVVPVKKVLARKLRKFLGLGIRTKGNQ